MIKRLLTINFSVCFPSPCSLSHLVDHFATRLLPFTLVGLLLHHVQDLVTRRAVLQGKLADHFAELVDAHLLCFMQWQTHVQQQFVVPDINKYNVSVVCCTHILKLHPPKKKNHNIKSSSAVKVQITFS